MKRQPYGSKSGFTLIELMVVIGIFGAFVLATNIFNYSPQTEAEKADRIMVGISSRLRTELQNISMWRMPKRDGVIAWAIRLDVGTWGMITTYLTWASGVTPISRTTFASPYFDGDKKYEIKQVTWTGSSSTPIGYVWSGQVIIEPNGISFSGAGITGSGYTNIEIRVWYGIRARKIILDRRTGKLIETKLY